MPKESKAINPVHVFYTENSIVLMVGISGVSKKDVRWMADDDVKGDVYVPGIDICDEKYIFSLDEHDEARRKYLELTIKYNSD